MADNSCKLVFDTFDRLRFPAALFVVWEHLTTRQGSVIAGKRFDPTEFDGFTYPVTFFDGFFLEPLAVPIFLFISGYLFFRSGYLTKSVYKKKIGSRIKTLLIPYVVWNLLGILVLIPKSLILGRYTLNMDLGNIINAMWIYKGGIVNDPLALDIPDHEWFTPIVGPLWYLRNLFILCLISPIIYILLKNVKAFFVIIVSLLWLSTSFWTQSDLLKTSIGSIAFFSWGGYSALCGEITIAKFKQYWKPLLVGGAVFSLLYFVFRFENRDIAIWIKKINSFIMLPALIGLSYSFILKRMDFNKMLANSSLLIYIAHMFIGPITVKGLLILLPINNGTIFFIYLLGIIVSVALLVGFYVVISRMPVVFQILFLGKKINKERFIFGKIKS